MSILDKLSDLDKEQFQKYQEDPLYVQVDEEGLILKRTLSAGTQEHPVDGCKVECHYTGWTLDGKKFDSSKDRGQPFEFDLGRHSVIAAWDKGVASMCVGESVELICHPDVAYGANGSPPAIPPNAVLRFEIDLLGFNWDCDDKPGDDKWAFVDEMKNEGNVAFKAGKTYTAIGRWNRANEVLYDVMEEEGADIDRANSMSATVMNNIAAAYVRVQKWPLVISTCDKVIAIDGQNVKALRRMSTAYIKTKRLEDAKKILEKVLEVDPENALSKKDLAMVDGQIAAAEAKKRVMYSRMFSGVSGFADAQK
ncbi:FKBP-type peptidyl-prolyl cis-trans isomerase [Carpediemonas membranifera]|uniref:peptidylprolyl isomerase n=1 Tax=Carpediemonas membranifera TaxID=201153 RepID=A0A8J6AWP0_9EUKA|nr:FKBP-type peptidyl-prolyl cis-trans isomerase [Carpediemonas membranifera]|eukprot:KAG9396043.1 FKBP-type peptidyl-prolyl cis-trans isomerase [Carpediemonas membranifera]